MCDDCSDTSTDTSCDTSDTTVDTSSDTTCDTSDTTSELPEDSGDLSDDGSEDLPEDDYQTEDVDMSEGDVELYDTESEADEVSDDGLETLPDESVDEVPNDGSEALPDENVDEVPDDGSETLPDDNVDEVPDDGSDELPENEKSEVPDDSSEELPEDEGIDKEPVSDEEYDNLTPIQQAEDDKLYAQRALDVYKNGVANGGKEDPALERDLNDRIAECDQKISDLRDGTYHDPNEELDRMVAGGVAKGISNSLSSAVGIDPLSKAQLGAQAEEFGKMYGPQIAEGMASTAKFQGGWRPPTPIVSVDEKGNVFKDYGQPQDVGDLKSTYQERLNQTPVSNGSWTGERGESTFISENEGANKYLNDAGRGGVEYRNCIPDFSPVSKGTIDIPNMSDNRPSNFRQADEQLANLRGCTPREVSNWRENNGYTWHECNNRSTCMKVPSVINSTFGHLGGVSECKKAQEDDFDE